MKLIVAFLIIFTVTARGDSKNDVNISTQPKQIAVIHEDGDIEVKLEPTQAAKEFWKLVREQAQQCKCTCPGDKKK